MRALLSFMFVLLWSHSMSQNIQPLQMNFFQRFLSPIRDSIKTSSLFPHHTRQLSVLQQKYQNPRSTVKFTFKNVHPSPTTAKTSVSFRAKTWNIENIPRVGAADSGREDKLHRRNPTHSHKPQNQNLMHTGPSASIQTYSPIRKQMLIRNQSIEQKQNDSKIGFRRKELANSFSPVTLPSNTGITKSMIMYTQPESAFTFMRKYNNIPMTLKPIHHRVDEVDRNNFIPISETRSQVERMHGPINSDLSVLSTKKFDMNNGPQAPQRWSPKMRSTPYRNSGTTWETEKNMKPLSEGKQILLDLSEMHELRQPTIINGKLQEIPIKLEEENWDLSSAHKAPLRVKNKTKKMDTEASTNVPSMQESANSEEHLNINKSRLSSKYEILEKEIFTENKETTLLDTLKPPNRLTTISGTPQEIQMLKIIDAINSFGLKLYHRLQHRGNLFFSPFSLSQVMAIILEGATNMTATQLMNGLHFSSSNIRQDEIRMAFQNLIKSLTMKRSTYELENANLILLKSNCPFKNEFSSNVYKYYNPLLGSVDFASHGSNIMRSVNDWVSRHTHGKINEFLKEPLSPNTVLAILNAVYFKGKWKNPFQQSSTHMSTFFNYGNQPIQTDMMLQYGTFATSYSSSLKTKAIELPYHGDKASMVILLPEERDGIQYLRKQLNYHNLNGILNSMRNHSIILSVPKISLREKYEMGDVFKEMGMKDMFLPSKASFGKMTNTTGLYVSDLFHEGAIDIDEKGTEAAAGTGISIIPLSMREKIEVDHPFVFIICNKLNGLILFLGQFSAFSDTQTQ